MRIAVVGAGVVGLTSAIRLREAGHAVTILAERRTPHITSDRAGAVFTPPFAPRTRAVRTWTAASFRALESLAREHPASGVRMGPVREFLFAPDPANPWWAECVPSCRRIPPPHPDYRDAFEALVPRIEIPVYMPWLESRARALDIEIHNQRIDSLDADPLHAFDAIIHCAGLGARELASDPAVAPMRGQVLHVPNDIALDVALVEEPAEGLAAYIFPYPNHIVLGGTYERDQWAEQTDEPTLERIIQRCRRLLDRAGLPGADRLARSRLRAVAGLRPARVAAGDDEAVRLERSRTADGRPLIHNYGHGRAGITLSWGCAEDVVRLVAARLA